MDGFFRTALTSLVFWAGLAFASPVDRRRDQGEMWMSETTEAITTRYLSGRMSPAEMEELEARLSADPGLRQEIWASQPMQMAAESALLTVGSSPALGASAAQGGPINREAKDDFRRTRGMSSGMLLRLPRIEPSPIQRKNLLAGLTGPANDGTPTKSIAFSSVFHALLFVGLGMLTYGSQGSGKPPLKPHPPTIRITFQPPKETPKPVHTALRVQPTSPPANPFKTINVAVPPTIHQDVMHEIQKVEQPLKQPTPTPTPPKEPTPPKPETTPTAKPVEPPKTTQVAETPAAPTEQPVVSAPVKPAAETPKTTEPAATTAAKSTETATDTTAATPETVKSDASAAPSNAPSTPQQAPSDTQANPNVSPTAASAAAAASAAPALNKAAGAPSKSEGGARSAGELQRANQMAMASRSDPSDSAFKSPEVGGGTPSSNAPRVRTNSPSLNAASASGPVGGDVGGARSITHVGTATGYGPPHVRVGQPGGKGAPQGGSGGGPAAVMASRSIGSSQSVGNVEGSALPGDPQFQAPRSLRAGRVPQAGSDQGMPGVVSTPGHGNATILPTRGGLTGVRKIVGSASNAPSTYGARRSTGGSGQVLALAPRSTASGATFGSPGAGAEGPSGPSAPGGPRAFMNRNAFKLPSGDGEAAGNGGVPGNGAFGSPSGSVRASRSGGSGMAVGPARTTNQVYGGRGGGRASGPVYDAALPGGSGRGNGAPTFYGGVEGAGTGSGRSGPSGRSFGSPMSQGSGSGSYRIAMGPGGRARASSGVGNGGDLFRPVFGTGGRARGAGGYGRGGVPVAQGSAGGTGDGSTFGVGDVVGEGAAGGRGGPRRGNYSGSVGDMNGGGGYVGSGIRAGGRSGAAGSGSGPLSSMGRGPGGQAGPRGGGGSSGSGTGPAGGLAGGYGDGEGFGGSGEGAAGPSGEGGEGNGPHGRNVGSADVSGAGSGGKGDSGYDATTGVLKRPMSRVGVYANLQGEYNMPNAVFSGDYGWHLQAVSHLLGDISKNTQVKVKLTQQYLDLAHQRASKAPVIVFTGHTAFTLNDEQREGLRQYVKDGGTVWGDFSGTAFDQSFRNEMIRIFGQQPGPIRPGTPVFNAVYPLDRVPAGPEGETRQIEGIYDPGDGRFVVIITPNRYFAALDSPGTAAYQAASQIGTNIYLYAVGNYQKLHPLGSE